MAMWPASVETPSRLPFNAVRRRKNVSVVDEHAATVEPIEVT